MKSKFEQNFMMHLAGFLLTVVIIYIFLVTFLEIPSENVRYVDTVLGFLMGTVMTTIINYFYGSSKSSSDKSNTLNNESKNVESITIETVNNKDEPKINEDE